MAPNEYGDQNRTCLIAPMKNPETKKEMRRSKWLESMQKDVECTFGIMKGRFRTLKIENRLQTIDLVDQLRFTCFALHNMF